jgi:hypothetical protein
MHMNFKLNKKIIKGKNAVFSLSLILMLSMTIIIALAQPSLAQVGVVMPEKTAGYASVAPTLLGVGQTATVNLWVFPLPTYWNYTPCFKGFYGLEVTFVKPDGSKDTFMPKDETGSFVAGQMQSLGALYFYYTPQMAGNWSVSFTLPAQNITDSQGNVQFLGCTSSTAHFTVQDDPVLAGLLNGYPWAELPNSNTYWTYPINANNREWYQIAGDWTGQSMSGITVLSSSALRWQPYGSGPNTAHIVWKQSIKTGGMIGGDYGSTSYVAGLNDGTVIMEGKVYVNIPNTTPVGQSFGQFQCFDEATGKLLYTANGSITNGIHFNLYSEYIQSNTATQEGGLVLLPNSYGSYQYPMLYGTVSVGGITYWNYYDTHTGTLLRQLRNATSARLIDGTVLAYGVSSTYGVFRWNLTSVVNNEWPTGITWKIPTPKPLNAQSPSLFALSEDASIIVVSTSRPNQFWAYNTATGASLWNLTLNYQVNGNEAFPLVNVDDFIVLDPTAATYKCYSIKTGSLLWESTSFANSPWATTWTLYRSETNDLNNLYVAQPDGSMRAFSLTDGHLVWTSKAIPSTEYANNAIPLVAGGLALVDNKLYVYAGYSINYQIEPVPRFATMICINATTGDTIYTLNGGIAPSAAANGYLIGANTFDGNMYCVGKGQTTTTVTAPTTSITAGTTAVIQGSVMDNSIGQPNTPAISDADMSVWMDYIHMQNSTLLNNPPQCTGVPVTLTAVDPNGNTITIGSTTSNYQGNYGFQWTPTAPGMYTIYASFPGSDSYYSSSASTYATVASTSATVAPTSATQPIDSNSDTIMYVVATGIAIVIAIAIATVLILRKK